MKAIGLFAMSERKMISAFLTGQSDPLSNSLSAEQLGFFRGCGLGDDEFSPWNFPYDRSAPVARDLPLWRASVSNSLQYLRSRRPEFAEKFRDEVMGSFDGFDRVVLLAGSCGLELLVNLDLPVEFRKRLWVFALGPVSRSVPVCEKVLLVQGNRDFISRRWHRTVDHVVPCGHMDYLSCDEVRSMFREFHREAKSS